MPETLAFPWVAASLATLLAAATLAWRSAAAEDARRTGCAALAASTLALLAVTFEVSRSAVDTLRLEPWGGGFPTGWFAVDALNAISLPLFSGLALGVVALAPRRSVTPAWVAGVLLMTAGTLAAYAAANLAILVIGWTGSVLPLLTRRFFGVDSRHALPPLSRLTLWCGVISLAIGAFLLATAASASAEGAFRLSKVSTGSGLPQQAAFILLIAAVMLRKGVVPFHAGQITAFEKGPLLPMALLMNAHLGAFILARVVITALPDVANAWLPILGHLGLITAVYAALLALAERNPRRLLALLTTSQSSFLLVGLESGNAHGIAGALVHWQVLAVASTVLICAYSAVESRIRADFADGRYLGLAHGAPRLAVFFLIGGLALVGLPLTLGFVAEDLLLHGALIRHPQFGVILPIVTALNAVSVLHLFAKLFFGQAGAEARAIQDALPRERWVLTVGILFLVIGGIFPGPFSRLPAAAAERLTAWTNSSH